MTETEFLLWVRGPAFQGATVIFVLGVAFRLLEILMLGRKPDLAEPRGSAMLGGLRTIATRSFPDAGTHRRSAFTHYVGYIFHIGFFVTLLLYAPHILVIEKAFGVSWPALPTTIVDATAVMTMIALIAVSYSPSTIARSWTSVEVSPRNCVSMGAETSINSCGMSP